MKNNKSISELIEESFFSFFGLCDDPIKEKAENVIKIESKEKIANDLKKIKLDQIKSFQLLRENILKLEQ